MHQVTYQLLIHVADRMQHVLMSAMYTRRAILCYHHMRSMSEQHMTFMHYNIEMQVIPH